MSEQMTSCPTCGKPVDSLRARSVGVRDGKVVAYCSAACARAAETQPTKVPIQPTNVPAKPTKLTKAEKAAARRTPAAGVAAGAGRTPATGVVTAAAGLDSGPVIEVIHPDSSGVARDDSTLPRWGDDDDDGGAAVRAAGDLTGDAGLLGSGTRSSAKLRVSTQLTARRRAAPLLVVLVVVVGGLGAFLAYRYLIAHDRGATTAEHVAPPTDAIADAAVELDAPAGPTAAASVARATEVLAALLESGTPRMQRVAAAALARTRHARAIEVLALALEAEKLDVARLDLAYALGRAEDPRGKVALTAALGSARRDIKAHAGRLLAELGDPRAIPVLVGYLGVSQLRLGVAGPLALLEEPRAIEVLSQIRQDARSSRDEKARATIALGLARRTDVTAELHSLLTDPHFNVFAASALAVLGDRAAIPVLVDQLAVPSLRVDAARSLRRIDPDLDATPYLPGLITALGSLKDSEQVQAAEAILILAGDVGWSEHR